MREIKFRIKTEAGVFIAPSNRFSLSLHDTVNMFIVWSSDGIIDEIPALRIEQFTELKDKNGKDIYEGDIVYLSGYGKYTCEFPFIELWEAYQENDIGEILGNIHENPELME